MQISPLITNNNISHKGFRQDYKTLYTNLRKASFKLSVNNTPQNLNAEIDATNKLASFIKENPIKSKIMVFAKNIRQHFMGLYLSIKNRYNPNDQAAKALRNFEKALSNKFNQITFKYNNEDFSYTEIKQIYKKETDVNKKNEIVNAINTAIKPLENDLRFLLKQRNNYAKAKGYENAHIQYTKLYGNSEEDIERSIKEFFESEETKKQIQKRLDLIAEEYNLSPEEAKQGFDLSLITKTDIDEYINSPEEAINFAKSSIQSMGFDLKKLEEEGKIVYEIKTDSKKSSSAYCKAIELGEIEGIASFAGSNVQTIQTLLHEIGHGLHGLKTSNKLPHVLKILNKTTTESVAMMFENLLYKEDLLNEKIPQKVLEKYKEYALSDELYQRINLILKTEFEREIAKNPDQDFLELYKRISKKYLPELAPEEYWFTPHLISLPSYQQNYILGFENADKIYSSLRNELGTEVSKNPKTADFLTKKIFRFGGLVNNKNLDKFLNL